MKRPLHALVLAAGKGTRFKSDTIKVLHPMMGKPMIRIMVDTLARLKPAGVHMVVGFQRESVMEADFPVDIDFIHQETQRGTAHAVMAASRALAPFREHNLLIINGDLPLIRTETLRPLIRRHEREDNALTFMSAVMADAYGFGRVINRAEGGFRIVEEKDATSAQRKLKEGNVGIYVFRIGVLLDALPRISNRNAKGEYYLTDIIEILSQDGAAVRKFATGNVDEIVGVNDRFEMARAMEVLRRRKIRYLTEKGVTFYDPSSTWIDFDVRIGSDTVVYPNVVLEGGTVIGRNAVLYPGVHVVDSRIGDDVALLSWTMVEQSRIADRSRVGPFSHLRPGTVLRPDTHVGNFVEMKKTEFGQGSKANHLSYIGDSRVGKGVNIGAGTITCNYDGVNKNRTEIGDGVFVGSGTQLVAPVKIGEGAYIGAGSTITKNVSPDALAVARGRQTEKPGWAERKRRKRGKK